MTIFPSFLVKRVYKKGSLRKTDEGIAFDLKNFLGHATITGFNSITVNESLYKSEVIKIITLGKSIIAETITPDNPLLFKLNQEGTLLLEGADNLKNGLNKIIVSLISQDAGIVSVTLTETI
ncbi:MAG: hypothetical protein WCK67_08830 [bacterium]